MSKPKPAETIFAWLRGNLGKGSLAALTGTDSRALCAAVQIIELYSYHPDPSVMKAFALVVRCGMQESTRELAYHAIAHVMNWSDRPRLWEMADLEPLDSVRRCAFEPQPKEAA